MKADDELNALFAEHVAGKFVAPNGCVYRSREAYEIAPLNGSSPIASYTTDANAVLPWLEKASPVAICYAPPNEPYPLGRWEIAIKADGKHLLDCLSRADTFPRAAVIALLRAKGVAL